MCAFNEHRACMQARPAASVQDALQQHQPRHSPSVESRGSTPSSYHPKRIKKGFMCFAARMLLFFMFLLERKCFAMQFRSQEHAQALQSCIMAGRQLQTTTWNSSVLEDALPNLMLHQIWWSSLEPKLNLTVITQLSVDRLEALQLQCSTFSGPLSAAIYLPLVQSLADGEGQLTEKNVKKLHEYTERVNEMHVRVEQAGKCQLDIMLFYEVFDDATSAMLYPVNALRNLARMQVRTPLLSAIDVDMMISHTLSSQLSQLEELSKLQDMALNRVALVLPAFEPTRTSPIGKSWADLAASVSKEELLRMREVRQIQQFKVKSFKRGHTPTNYTLWAISTEPYAVQYQKMYEPWFITHWDVMPWFDVNYKGYGLNKIVHVASLNYYGFNFKVHPTAWIIHRPHADTQVRRAVIRQAADERKLGVLLPRHALYHKITSLYSQAKVHMAAGSYTARVDPQMVACMNKLTWLQPYKQLSGSPFDMTVFDI